MVGTNINALSQNNHNREDVILCGHSAYVHDYMSVMYSVCVYAWGTRETDRGTRSPRSSQRPPSPVQADPRATGHYWLETRGDPGGGTHRTTERPKPLDQTLHSHLRRPTPSMTIQPTASGRTIFPAGETAGGHSRRPGGTSEKNVITSEKTVYWSAW